MNHTEKPLQEEIAGERQALLEVMQDWLETPMLVLAFIWLALFIVEIVWGLSPILEITGYLIWGIFLFEFVLGFILAPSKTDYFKHSWLKALALLAPALRIFRLMRILRLARLSRAASMTRGLRLLRVLSSLNRSMRALSSSMGRRGFGYVLILTLIVILAGGAGMFAFEREHPDAQGLSSYGHAVWWTAMIITSLGSDYWPQTSSGRILCFFLSLYGFSIFGYVTAVLATFFLDTDAKNKEAELASARSISKLHSEIVALRKEIRALKKGSR